MFYWFVVHKQLDTVCVLCRLKAVLRKKNSKIKANIEETGRVS